MRQYIKIILTLLIFASIYILFNNYFKFELEKSLIKNDQKIEDKNIINKKNKKSEIDLLFVGDIMLDRNIRKIINENIYAENFVNNFLKNLSVENKKYDYVIANLEGPITENNTKTYTENGKYTGLLTFTFATNTMDILNLLNIKIVSLANNHTDNFYNKGFQDTKRYLNTKNIKYFGNPYNDIEKESISNIICEKGICIAYVGYNEFTINNDKNVIEKEILKLKENKEIDFIIVIPHWGIEYELLSNQNQKYLAHNYIDAGADMVIGGHPHVVEESEIYKGKYIYYSLGNYIFDQWFNEDVKNGLTVNFKFKKEILDSGEIKKDIEFVKEIKLRSEKTGIMYIEN